MNKSNPRKVLFLIDVLETFGGAEKNLFQIYSGLNPDKFEPLICCLKGGECFRWMKKNGVNVRNLGLKRVYSIHAFVTLLRLLGFVKRKGYAVIVTYFDSSDFYGLIIGTLGGIPVISNRRDMGFKLKKRHVFVYRLINRFFYKIIVVSEAVKTNIVKTEKANGSNILCISNGVDGVTSGPVSDKNAMLRSLNLPNCDFKIVTVVANLYPMKGHMIFLNAAKRVVALNTKVKFLCVGKDLGQYKTELDNEVHRHNLEKYIIFTGYRPDIGEILSISDICVLPSLTEGMSNAILEYMLAGKPVVATDVGGNRELIDNGINGFIVAPGDCIGMAEKMLILLSDPELCKKMGDEGRNIVKAKFSTESMIRETENLLNTV
ncbi:MAG TPA: glycosyltransferase [Candidatus Omnitrophota bacterium]|nr:glycosyltransferase [Candidatus Omnitrophota bacterium]